MASTVSLRQVEELATELPFSDQQRLIERMTRRLQVQEQEQVRASAFLKTCLEGPVRPAAGMDSGKEIAAIRAERGEGLS